MTAQNLKTAFTLMNNEKNLKKRAPANSDIKTYTFKKFVYEAPYFLTTKSTETTNLSLTTRTQILKRATTFG